MSDEVPHGKVDLDDPANRSIAAQVGAPVRVLDLGGGEGAVSEGLDMRPVDVQEPQRLLGESEEEFGRRVDEARRVRREAQLAGQDEGAVAPLEKFKRVWEG